MTPSAASLKAIRERRVALGDPIVLITESERDNLFDVIDALAGALKGVALCAPLDAPAAIELYAWCDDGWTCRHECCVAARAALALVDPA